MPTRIPQLSLPYQKPSPAAQLDWGHPLTAGLAFYAMPGGMHRRDLVSGGLGKYIVQSSSTPTSGGPYGVSTGLHNVSSIANGLYYPFSANLYNVLNGTHNLTLFIITRIQNSTTHGYLISVPYNATNFNSPGGLYLKRASNTTQANFNYPDNGGLAQTATCNTGFLPNSAPGVGLQQSYCVVRAAATTNWYVNGNPFQTGLAITDNPLGFGAQTFGGSNGPTIANQAFSTQGNTQGLDCAVMAIWGRALTAGEVKSMSADPYQVVAEPSDLTRSVFLIAPVPPVSGVAIAQADSALAVTAGVAQGAAGVAASSALGVTAGIAATAATAQADSALATTAGVAATAAAQADSALAQPHAGVAGARVAEEANSQLSAQGGSSAGGGSQQYTHRPHRATYTELGS